MPLEAEPDEDPRDQVIVSYQLPTKQEPSGQVLYSERIFIHKARTKAKSKEGFFFSCAYSKMFAE